MSGWISREKAFELLKEKLAADHMIKHSLATEAIMRDLAAHFGEDADEWGIAGLLHDLDLETVDDDPATHGKVTVQWLSELGCPETTKQAILAHNAEGLGVPRESRFDYALTCGEQITGLIVATALVMPSKKLADVKAKSVKKRFKDKRFAAKVSRERIAECEKIGFTLEEFIELSLAAMQKTAEPLGM